MQLHRVVVSITSLHDMGNGGDKLMSHVTGPGLKGVGRCEGGSRAAAPGSNYILLVNEH